MPPLTVGLSPCPNDTYLFHSWITGHVGANFPITPVFADIQQLNKCALERKFPVSKVSISCLGQILDDYLLLPTGCALGYGGGPKLVAQRPCTLADLAGKRIAIPGRDTTAHLLLQLLCDMPMQPVFCTYDAITTLIQKQEVEAGLIIHETRLTFAKQGFVEIADLGELWHARYDLPLPLGGIAAKRALGRETLSRINTLVAQSLNEAKRHPERALPFILTYSQEKDPRVVQEHIDLYVNDETAKMTEQGRQSIETLFSAARERGLMPKQPQPFIFEANG